MKRRVIIQTRCPHCDRPLELKLRADEQGPRLGDFSICGGLTPGCGGVVRYINTRGDIVACELEDIQDLALRHLFRRIQTYIREGEHAIAHA